MKSFRRRLTPVWAFLVLFLSGSAAVFAQSAASVSLFTIPTAPSAPEGITSGPDGALWFAECQSSKIGKITVTGDFTEYVLPYLSACPYQIVSGSDGALWFTEIQNFNNQIGRITTTGAITEFALPNSLSPLTQALGIAPGPDGALWFTSPNTSQVGRITTAGQVTMFPLPVRTTPGSIAAGPDGALWFLNNSSNISIGRITTAGVITTFPLPAALAGALGAIVAGKDGAMWFTDRFAFGSAIGRITTAGVITSFPVPSALYGLTVGPDGSLWFASNTTTLGRITTSGTYTANQCVGQVISTNAAGVCFPNQIVFGSNGNLWFTDLSGNFIGQVQQNGFAISSISPASVTLGSLPTDSTTAANTFNLNITGTGFVKGATVQFNGTTLLSTTFISTTQLIATVTASINPGAYAVSVINTGQSVSNAVTLTVNPKANTTVSVSTPSPLPSGIVGVPYSLTLAATGGTAPYTWSILFGSLPAGLRISSSGVIAGTPLTAGTQTFTVILSDSAAVPATQALTLAINPAGAAGSSLRIPQILDGGGWSTGFTIVNLDSVAVAFSFQFWDDNGNPLAFPVSNQSPGTLSGTLNPGATLFAASTGFAPTLQQGWAEVASSGKIGVTASYQLRSSGSRGAEVAITSAPAGNGILVPFDNTQGNTSAIALANANATQTLAVTLNFLTDTGAASSVTVNLAPKAHTALVLPSAYPALANARGSVSFTAPSADLSVTGLRFAPPAVGAITALGAFDPATISAGTVSIPQILDGGGWTTGFAIVNLEQRPVNFSTRFWSDSGAALPFPIAGGPTGTLAGTINPGATFFAQSPGTAASALQGWAEFSADGRIGVTSAFQFSGANVRGSQASVIGTQSGSSIFMPFDNTQGHTSAIAIANTNATQTLTVTLTALTDSGVPSSATLMLAPKAHTAFVLTGNYPTLANARGSIHFTASSPDIAVTGLRFAPTIIGAITSLGTF